MLTAGELGHIWFNRCFLQPKLNLTSQTKRLCQSDVIVTALESAVIVSIVCLTSTFVILSVSYVSTVCD